MQKSLLVPASAALLGFALLLGTPARVDAQLPKTIRVFKTSSVGAAQGAFTTSVVAARKTYAQSLDAALKSAMAAGSLDEANAINAVKTALGSGGESPAAGFKSPPATQAKAIYDSTIARAKTQYVAVLQSAQKTVMASGDLNEANTIQQELSEVSGTAPNAGSAPAASSGTAGAKANGNAMPDLPPNALVIEALIDGPSELRVQKDSIFWNNESNAKPGRHNAKKEATYVNGVAWQPEWKNPADRGTDQSKPYLLPVPLEAGRLEFKLISVSSKRGDSGIQQRDPIKAKGVGTGYSVLIPDSQSGTMWYKFAVFSKGF